MERKLLVYILFSTLLFVLTVVQGYTCKEAWNKIPAIMTKLNAPSITIMATKYRFGQYCKYIIHFDSFDEPTGFIKPETLDK